MFVGAMDSRKIQQVRQLIAGGFYTDREVLDFILEALIDGKYEQLMGDIKKCDNIKSNSLRRGRGLSARPHHERSPAISAGKRR